jgi:alpha-beta hydrolase superfamily lysophospholipase
VKSIGSFYNRIVAKIVPPTAAICYGGENLEDAMFDHPVARRSIIAGAGAGLVSSLVTDASAQQKPEIQASEHWAQKGDVKLNLWRKRIAPQAGVVQPVLFLVHGSSNSARSSYDLSIPGKTDYSLMNVMAGYGFDVWTMDHDGYGRSGWSGGNSDIASGVEDLKAALPIVLKETGRPKIHMYGTSSGAIRAGAYAQAAPERIDRLILAAFTYKGTGSPEIARRNAVADRYRNSPRRKRDLAMIRSIFTRDGHASAYDLAVADAIAAEELQFGDTVPTGTYLDMAVNLPLVDPKKVTAPVLMIRGEHDGNSTNEDLLDFYTQLPNGDRQFAILPHTAHSIGYSNNRHLLWYAMRNFLAAPPAVGA